MRRLVLASSAGTLLCLGILLVLTARPSPPSILLVTLDTTRADRLSCYSPMRAHTPRIDALAAEGVLFEQAETVAPLTLPSHSSILTGVFPPDHGVRNNGFYRLRPEVETLTERLKAAGYRTAAFVSSMILDAKFGLDQGFEVYGDDFGKPLNVGDRFPVSRRARETVDETIAWLDGIGDEPFFVWTHLYDPHAPYDPPPPYKRAYFDSPYQGEIAYADLALEPLFAKVREMRGEEIVIVVTGDHGEALGEHREATHGFFAYESTIHVPLVVLGGPFRGGRRISEPVRTVDIAPTLLSLAGEQPPEGIRGRDLELVLTGQLNDLPCYSEAWIPRMFGWSGIRALRIGDFKLMEGGSRTTLLHLASDPEEHVDFAVERPGDVERLAAAMGGIRVPPGVAPGENLLALGEEDVAALQALGYLNAVGGSPQPSADVVDPTRHDPRDRVHLYRMVQNSRGMIAGGKADEAVDLISKVVAEESQNPSLRMERVGILLKAGRESEAIEDLTFALEHLPEDPRPAAILGRLCREKGDLEGAEAALRTALARSPNHYLSLFHLGEILLEARRFEEAVETYEHVLRLRDNDARAMNNLAFALIRGGLDRDRGFALLLQAVETRPRDGELRQSLGDALLRVGRKEEAIVHLLVARDLLGDRPALLELIRRAK